MIADIYLTFQKTSLILMNRILEYYNTAAILKPKPTNNMKTTQTPLKKLKKFIKKNLKKFPKQTNKTQTKIPQLAKFSKCFPQKTSASLVFLKAQ